MLLDVDRREHVVLHQALAQHDRVLEVVTLPGHERDEQVLAERELAVHRGRTVGEHVALAHLLTGRDDRLLVDAGALVRTAELGQPVRDPAVLLVLDGDGVAGDVDDLTVVGGEQHVARVAGGAALDTGTDVGSGGPEQRHGLALHVGAHERAVRIVVLEERDERRRDRHQLLRRHVHVVDLARSDVVDLAATGTHEHPLFEEVALLVDAGVRLRDDVLVFVVGGEIRDLVADAALLDLAVRGLDEPEPVDPAEAREVADQTDVRAFRRLDRAHAAVVARVHVSDLEAGALTRQTTRSERRQAALVRETRERVRLVHELRQLRRPEELLDRRDHGPDVDQRLRRDRLDVLGRHALAHDPLHAAEADTQLVLDQLADRAHPAVAEVVDVVGEVAGVAVVQLHEVRDRREDVGLREREVAAAALDVRVGDREVEALEAEERVLLRQLLRDLVPADLRLVVTLGVEEQVLEQRTRGVGRGRFARAQLAVDVDERFVDARRVVLLERVAHRLVRARPSRR